MNEEIERCDLWEMCGNKNRCRFQFLGPRQILFCCSAFVPDTEMEGKENE